MGKKTVIGVLTVPLAIVRVNGLHQGDTACDRDPIHERIAPQRGRAREIERKRETEIEIKTGIDRSRS